MERGVHGKRKRSNGESKRTGSEKGGKVERIFTDRREYTSQETVVEKKQKSGVGRKKIK